MFSYFENDPARASRDIILAALGSGALSYVHGLCGALLGEMKHEGLGRWLGSVSMWLYIVTVILIFLAGLMRHAWQSFQVRELQVQNQSTRAHLAAQEAISCDDQQA